MERAHLTTATFEVLDELVENGDSLLARAPAQWCQRLTEISERLLDDTVNVNDTLVLVAVTALTAAHQLEGADV
jgi:hypothetical protein